MPDITQADCLGDILDISANTDPATAGSATATDNCDNAPAITFSDSIAAGSCPQERTVTRTWTATDDCGNASNCDQVITVVDDEAPVMSCPADVTVNCEDDVTPPAVTATDNCDNDVTITFNASVADGSCPQEEVITRTWVAEDDCGNSLTCVQVVTVVDDEAPAITCPDDITVECTPGIGTADCLGDLISIALNTSLEITGNPTVSDNCDTDLDVDLSDSTAAGSCPQEKVITRTWTATDDCGNSSDCDQVVTVVDNTAPVITCPADTTVNCEDDSSSAATGSATATDNCDNGVSITEGDSVAAGSCPQEEVITRTWTATDDCGNASSCDQVVTVVDDEAPAITCPANSTVECMPSAGTADCLGGLATIAASTGLGVTGSATATDNCGTPAIDFSDSVAAGSCPQEKEITRTWTATDECGNSSACDQIINVVDVTAPAITCPADTTVNCEDDSSSANTGSASATDNCDNEIDIVESDNVASGSCPQEEVITRTWTATDDCGNSSSCDQAITVVDDTVPNITCPSDLSIECVADLQADACLADLIAHGSLTDPAAAGSATVSDNCDTDLDVGFGDSVADGSCPQEKVITRTWTTTDDCGNSNSCDQTITVTDDTAPVITCPADTTVNCQDDRSSAATGSATATDNCDNGVSITEGDSVAAGS